MRVQGRSAEQCAYGRSHVTGRTPVATAIGLPAIQHHRRKACFFSTIVLVNALEHETAKGKAGQIAETLTRLDLLILMKWDARCSTCQAAIRVSSGTPGLALAERDFMIELRAFPDHRKDLVRE